MKKVMLRLAAVGCLVALPMSPRSMRKAIIHNQRARCARGLTFRSTKYKRTLRRRLPRGGSINKCATSKAGRTCAELSRRARSGQ
jgi:hypothetical protein